MAKMTSMAAATASKDYIKELETLAGKLAEAIDTCESMRDLAALSRQYRETVRELDELRGSVNDDPVAAILAG